MPNYGTGLKPTDTQTACWKAIRGEIDRANIPYSTRMGLTGEYFFSRHNNNKAEKKIVISGDGEYTLVQSEPKTKTIITAFGEDGAACAQAFLEPFK
ncbi:MAG TPA: hypothetical protein PKE69_19420 [Pyrinomonadaceae bacterium]|nr:hypothetical protein [Pyrinomonadaceae bacterium]